MKKLVVVALLLVGGCSANSAYVIADRATFDAIAPDFIAYVGSDSSLDDNQKERRLEVVRSWKARLERAEGEK